MKRFFSALRRGLLSLSLSFLFVLSFAGHAPAASHTVMPGDTLWEISKMHGATVNEIKQANSLAGDIIFPGQILHVPGWRAVSRGTGPGGVPAADFDVLARIITAEADNQSYETMVAVGAVVLNRMESSLFPDTVRGVVYHVDESGRYQFEPVLNGWINRPASESAKRAARDALNGWDPTNGALFFWESWVKNGYLNSRPVSRVMGAFTFTY